MKKVLILTYYWPPSGGAGVQRWLKFVKYLPEFGITPIVYTHSNGEIPSIDESLEREIPNDIEVLKTEIWEPYSTYKKLVGKKDEKINTGFLSEKKTKKSRMQNFAVWVRGNFFIPDARKFWIKPSVKFLEKYIADNNIDCIISSGPPHSMHLIALGLKMKLNIPWIADFRDPWTNIDFYKDLKLSKWADKKHHALERKVLEHADFVISVGDTLTSELSELGAKHTKTITNGYDNADLSASIVELDAKFSIAHIGSLTKTRNPDLLWKALSELCQENKQFAKDLEIKLVGKIDYFVKEQTEKYKLHNHIRKIAYIPHTEVIMEQKKTHLLLLIVNDAPNAKGIITGKVFEYMASERPILALAPKGGDLEKVINETSTGKCFEVSEKDELKRFIMSVYINEYNYQPHSINKYTRKKLTETLVDVINEVC